MKRVFFVASILSLLIAAGTAGLVYNLQTATEPTTGAFLIERPHANDQPQVWVYRLQGDTPLKPNFAYRMCVRRTSKPYDKQVNQSYNFTDREWITQDQAQATLSSGPCTYHVMPNQPAPILPPPAGLFVLQLLDTRDFSIKELEHQPYRIKGSVEVSKIGIAPLSGDSDFFKGNQLKAWAHANHAAWKNNELSPLHFVTADDSYLYYYDVVILANEPQDDASTSTPKP